MIPTNSIILGDCVTGMRNLPAASVDSCYRRFRGLLGAGMRRDRAGSCHVHGDCSARWHGWTGRVPHYQVDPAADQMFFKNVSVAGGPAPTRAYVPELLPDVMEGRINPGRVFDRTIGLNSVPDGYRAMNEREALKVMIRP